MKKYIILTSVIALAACGGGGGGGGSHVTTSYSATVPGIPSAMRGEISSEDMTSNGYVTKMKSEVLIASKGGQSQVVRASSMPGENGYVFTSYRLDDVKLFVADAAHTDDAFLQLGLNEDTGRIENVQMVVGGVGAPAARQGADSHLFRAPILEYVRDSLKYTVADSGQTPEDLELLRQAQGLSSKGYWVKDDSNWKYYKLGDEAVFRMVETAGLSMGNLDEIKDAHPGWGVGHWNRVDEVMDIVTYGGDIDGNGTKLQYADFGHFNPVYATKYYHLTGGDTDEWTANEKKDETAKLNDKLASEDYQLFAGGYAIKNGSMVAGDRPSLDPVVGTTYKGMAIGRVYTSIGGENYAQRAANFAEFGIEDTGNENDGHDIAKLFTTKNATMTISQAGGKVVQTLNMPFYTDPDDANHKYYDVTIVKTGNEIGTPTFTATDESEIESKYQLHGAEAHWDTESASFNPGYYGVNTPTEAAGSASIHAGYDLTNGAERDYEVQAAYGMKVQQ